MKLLRRIPQNVSMIEVLGRKKAQIMRVLPKLSRIIDTRNQVILMVAIM
jgi:hypothetical protein